MELSSLKEWLQKLKESSQKEGVYTLVEGKRDLNKLKELGVKNIYPIKGKRFYDILEDLENAHLVIILTDLDKQGEKMYKKLSFILEREGVPVEGRFREKLKEIGIKHIEDIPVRSEDVSKENNTLS
ncbi:5S rRNA maturation endonuclease (Ribonuclease M5), contains TOPRIM domain [Persephonella hydrogeniphila]|uniref:5S rRNA maturation endonuclease (Ribonuclease M5), contains TOPRIM domain n=1 Tax=Persephonella hydrogeniphila TaxID=198703 RepID=A0A285N0N8_9AQUI|nr:toprim domain-containing protein [Persephonella hydrogeniphila]SNZ02493.1 5S rRNA maturation endonuclease (Ribonuclease M5), contains TOPRIM domain [Persephonella hydrogeniphila]